MFYDDNDFMLTSCLTFTAFQSFSSSSSSRLPTIYLTFSPSSIPITMEIFLFSLIVYEQTLNFLIEKIPQSFGEKKFNTRYLSLVLFLYHQIQKDRKFVDMKTNWERQNEIFITNLNFIQFLSISEHAWRKKSFIMNASLL